MCLITTDTCYLETSLSGTCSRIGISAARNFLTATICYRVSSRHPAAPSEQPFASDSHLHHTASSIAPDTGLCTRVTYFVFVSEYGTAFCHTSSANLLKIQYSCPQFPQPAMARAESGDHCRREKRVGLTLKTQEKRRDTGAASREEARHGRRPPVPARSMRGGRPRPRRCCKWMTL